MTATQARTRLGAAAVIFITLAICGLTPAAAAKASKPAPEPLEAVRGPYIVVDVASGRVIKDYDALRPWYPASTTKLMTLYVTLQAIRAGEIDLASTVRYGANAANQPASKMGFKPGTTLKLDDAIKMMMVKSANDIAVAIAETVGGSTPAFATRMNAAAAKLGMTRTHFANPNGLPDENNYTSARDMALLARALLTEFQEYDRYFHIHAIEIGGRVLKNYNSLLARYPGATGMKTGFICASGYNLIASAKRGAREVVAVVFGEYGGKLRTQHAAQLLDEGFESEPPPPDAAVVQLADVTSGAKYRDPLDMRPYVCSKQRVRLASEANEEGDEDAAAPSLMEKPMDLGPPLHVSALVPYDYGEAGFVAPLPRPRPIASLSDGILNAYAPGDGGNGDAGPEGAIGEAAGNAKPLDSVPAQ